MSTKLKFGTCANYARVSMLADVTVSRKLDMSETTVRTCQTHDSEGAISAHCSYWHSIMLRECRIAPKSVSVDDQ